MRIITLLTDFGEEDYFVGAMKGAIVSINPEIKIIDIAHQIPAQDIQAAAFNLLSSYKAFPAGTIHVGVVDPGVGSNRKAIVIECASQFFVAPDNGLLSWICQRERNYRAHQLTNEQFFRERVSATFHGRDIFAPVAAHLSNGIPPADFGPVLNEIVHLASLEPSAISRNTIEGRIIHIDRFGNCVTNFAAENLSSDVSSTSCKITIDRHEINSFHSFFSDAKRGEVFCTIGSAGFLEIAVRNNSAAELLGITRGQSLQLSVAELADIKARAG